MSSGLIVTLATSSFSYFLPVLVSTLIFHICYWVFFNNETLERNLGRKPGVGQPALGSQRLSPPSCMDALYASPCWHADSHSKHLVFFPIWLLRVVNTGLHEFPLVISLLSQLHFLLWTRILETTLRLYYRHESIAGTAEQSRAPVSGVLAPKHSLRSKELLQLIRISSVLSCVLGVAEWWVFCLEITPTPALQKPTLRMEPRSTEGPGSQLPSTHKRSLTA